MPQDDEQIGRILSRRQALGLLGLGGVGLAVPGRAGGEARAPFRLPACIVRPEQTEGPYFVDTRLDRSDIRSDPTDGSVCDGAPLELTFLVSRIGGGVCEPLGGALVDVWQCDALGVYSGVEDFQGQFDTRGRRFLRGHQFTAADGTASFTTIYPGWYEGRAVHIHFKIRTDPGDDTGFDFTSQVYFDDGLTDRVHEGESYLAKAGERPRNLDDRIYRGGGSQLMLDVTEADGTYRATFDVGLQIDPPEGGS